MNTPTHNSILSTLRYIVFTRIPRKIHFLLSRAFFHRYSFLEEIERAAGGFPTLLDVGCGAHSPVRSFSGQIYSVGIDLFDPSISASREQGIHTEYVRMDMRDIGKKFKPRSFDCVLSVDTLEHVTREEGFAMLAAMETIAKKRVVVVTPNGYIDQQPYDNNPLQKHRSGWTAGDFRRKGYRVFGVHGWKPLRNDATQIRFRPEYVWEIISAFTSVLFARRFPKAAFHLLCIKDIDESGYAPHQMRTPSDLIDALRARDTVLDRLAARGTLTADQMMFQKAVSLFRIFERGGHLHRHLSGAAARACWRHFRWLAEKFPRIESDALKPAENIRYHPFLNHNLLRILNLFLSGIQKALAANTASDPVLETLAEILSLEKKKIGTDLEKTCDIIERVPDLISKNMRPLRPDPPPERPRVSIITTSLNMAAMVDETMRSIANQSFRNYENICVDGASSDNSVALMKKYPNLVLVSEKDNNQLDALWKGWKIARGDYVLQCCISDCYANADWIKRCVETLDANPEVSLVWGFPCGLTEESKLWKIFYTQFYYQEAPQKEAMFSHWLQTYFVYPDVSFCVRREVYLKTFPTLEECSRKNAGGWDVNYWCEFTYRFNKAGYLSMHLPIIANYGRTHTNQLGHRLAVSGQDQKNISKYQEKTMSYRRKLMAGLAKHTFIGPDGHALPIQFNKARFAQEFWIRIAFLFNKARRCAYPKNQCNAARRIIARFFPIADTTVLPMRPKILWQ